MKKILLSLILFCSLATAFCQRVKISEMPTADNNGLGAYIPIVQDGINKKILADSLLRDIVVGKLLYIDTLNGRQRINVDSLRLMELITTYGSGSGGVNSDADSLGGLPANRYLKYVDSAAMLLPYGNAINTNTVAIATKQTQLNGTGFVKASGTTISYDNSTYLTTASAASTYQPILISGTNIKTINGTNILGSGDISISGGGTTAYDSQTASAAQQAFTFPAVPTSYDDFWIDINGDVIQQSFYTKSGNVVTFTTGLVAGDIATYHRIK